MHRNPPYPSHPRHPLSYRLLALGLALLLPVQTSRPIQGECREHGQEFASSSAMTEDAHAGHAMASDMMESGNQQTDQSDCDHTPAASTCAPCTVPAFTTVVDVGAEPDHRVRSARVVFDVPASVVLIPDGPPPRA